MTILGIPKRKKKNNLKFKKDYEAYYPVVYKHLYYLSGSNEIAEDLTQDVFIKYLDYVDKNITYPGAWLSKVATNLAKNYFRSHQRRENREMDIFLDTQEIFMVEDHIFRLDEIQRVRKVLLQLNDKQRMCLLLKFSGYSYDEIHETTQIPRNNIGKTIARGKEKFMSLYREVGEEHVS